jgi:hypothetical protein
MFGEYSCRRKYRRERHLLMTLRVILPHVSTADLLTQLFLVHDYFVIISYFRNLTCVYVDCGLLVEAIYIWFVAPISLFRHGSLATI